MSTSKLISWPKSNCLPERSRIIHHTATDRLRDAPSVMDVCKRIGFKKHHVGLLPRLNGTKLCVETHDACGHNGCRLQGFHGREPCLLDIDLKLTVQAVSRHALIGSSNDVVSVLVQSHQSFGNYIPDEPGTRDQLRQDRQVQVAHMELLIRSPARDSVCRKFGSRLERYGEVRSALQQLGSLPKARFLERLSQSRGLSRMDAQILCLRGMAQNTLLC